ncbi:MAG: rhodanese-like domain-containing protein [Thermodesulfobacteriota bacterium]|nr:rhodanese-like domain-containing protein [Thermodesulfobacteriota bacterium]
MKKILVLVSILFLSVSTATSLFADTKDAAKAFLSELKKNIPQGKIVSTDDLFKKWQEVQAGTSKALIIDIRTEAEFDAGHLKDANNVDSGHAYGIPKKWSDPEREMWIFCRTQQRAGYFVSLLYKFGYKNVYLVKGGVKEWAEKGYPLYNKYLGEIKVIQYHKKLAEDFLYRENK